MWFGKPFFFADNVAIVVRDLDAAIAWYATKLGLRRTAIRSDEFDALLTLSKKDEPGLALVLVRPGESTPKGEPHPILFTKNIESAHKYFSKQGVQTGSIQSDSGGNRFFQFHDPDGNAIEVCTEPQ